MVERHVPILVRFNIAAFDAKAAEIGVNDIPVPLHSTDVMAAFIKEHKVALAILCVPGEQAQQVANGLVNAGIQGVLNFSPVVLKVPQEITVNNVDLALELEHLNYFVRK